jgi:DNA-binding Xre family transcriptional regulator
MIEFDTTFSRLRQLLTHTSHKKKILDKEIAAALHLSPQYFAVIKRRKKIPYDSLAHFCKTHRINLNWLLLGQEPPYLT